jgi:hypothetical protein
LVRTQPVHLGEVDAEDESDRESEYRNDEETDHSQ